MRPSTLLTVAILCMLVFACGPTAAPVIVTGSAPATPGSAAPTATGPAVPDASSGEISLPDEGADHVAEGTQVSYAHQPPASGPHYPTVLQYGLYENEDVPAEYWVHSLEHGAVVILYKCPQACPDLVKALGDMLDLFPLSKWNNRKIVIAPYSKMEVPLMAVAWRVQMPLDRFDQQALIDFYARHVDQGPEDVP